MTVRDVMESQVIPLALMVSEGVMLFALASGLASAGVGVGDVLVRFVQQCHRLFMR